MVLAVTGTESTTDTTSVPWRRRPRRPLPALLRDWRIWFLPVFLVGVAFLAGFGVVVSEPAWWARTAGGGVSLLSVAAVVALVLYLRRPVVDDRWDPDAPWVRTAVDGWAGALARHGYVDLPRSRRRVLGVAVTLVVMLGLSVVLLLGLTGPTGRVIGGVCLLVLVPLGLLPQLEAATAHGPAVHVDGHGIALPRWRGLAIPWSAVAGVDVLVSRSSKNALVYVTPEFYDAHQARRPRLLRAIDRVSRHYSQGPSFTIPATAAARPFPLALWLDAEATARNPAVGRNDQPAG